MDSLGTEIGQKMRSAVKAKLIELGTGSASGYIDDELPDYVMIMVANKRSRQQMVDDLSLFLGAQTEVFVNWLHQVLQKLQEVTLPASAAAKSKESAKKKSSEVDDKRKDKKRKEKKTKRRDRSTDGEEDANAPGRMSGSEDNTPPRPAVVLPAGSITEVFANQYIEKAKKSLDTDEAPITKKPLPSVRSELREQTKSRTPPPPPAFDVPSIAEMTSAAVVQKHHKELCELMEIEQRISEAKRHLKSLGTDISDEDDEDLLHLKANEDDLQPAVPSRSNQPSSSLSATRQLANKPSELTAGKQRQRITMASEEPAKHATTGKNTTAQPAPSADPKQTAKKRSVLDRLGTKGASAEGDKKYSEPTPEATKSSNTVVTASGPGPKSTIISLSAHRREEREIYVPLFRRKEASEEPPPPQARPRHGEPTIAGQRPNNRRERERSRERMNRDGRSPPAPPKIRLQSHTRFAEHSVPRAARSRENNFRSSVENPRPENPPVAAGVERRSRARERSRSREWPRDIKRERSGSAGRGVTKNGTSGEATVRSRIGSRVIVLPPKPDYNEDVVEVPVASVIKVQPRPILPKAKQPSKNLLLKAMAEAQRSTVANLKKTIDNSLALDGGLHRIDIKRKLLIEIPGAAHPMVCGEEYEGDRNNAHYARHRFNSENREEVDEEALQQDVVDDEEDQEEQEEEEEEVHEVDIANEVLMEECDVDEEFKEILDDGYNNKTHTKPPAHGREEHHLEMTEETEEVALSTAEPAVDSKDTKFVVTLDGAFKASVERDGSPSHTPPPPPIISDVLAKARMSVKDRIGFKVGGVRSELPPRPSPSPKDSKEMEETLKKRKERFTEQLVVAAAATTKQPLKPSSPTPTPASSGSSSANTKSQRSNSSRSTHTSHSRRQRTPSLSPEPEPPKPRHTQSPPPQSRGSKSRTGPSRNVSSSPSQLNELLLQRTKELMDDSVSSSPIYMSKSDYDKMEPASRKRKRVSPIQFDLTDEDERHDSDDDYHHHHHHHYRDRDRERDRDHRERERRARSREDHHLRRSRSRDSEERATTRKESRREWEREGESRRDSREARLKSPGKKIKKLESSRKFDDVPSLLSAVSLAGAESKGGSIKERCKYFPNCRQGDACEFLHPSTPCKAFPSCKFGDMCLYLHPMCKFDPSCHRVDCNFMHTKSAASVGSGGLSAPPLASSVVPVQNYKSITTKPLPPVCKFYPHCVNSQCQYLHPKMCRFGKHCVNKIECNFYHYDIPSKDLHDASSKDKFKWISPFSA
uniref:Zinc finger CCCH domain-containing protein 14 n=1 Tax=Anopheles dirus TaxID=7168 RepID=A0A182NCX4_9DIPT